MSLAYQSIATINSPQFINLQPLDINPLMSSCQIKVLYLGANRNKSYISKQVASDMAKTLRGAPIVGYYKKDKQDFGDHGQQMIIDDEGVHFNCLTKPYGFVSPNAEVWFQDFQDQDSFGNVQVRTYLMTTGYLWTNQFDQVKQIINEGGKPQSMELDENSLKGQWSTNIKENMDFFIINDAIFSKLCILGDDVEPCFEGAAITPIEPKTSFTLDNDFKQSLFKMMEELKYTLEGGNKVSNIKDIKEEEKNFTIKKQDKINEFSQNKNDTNTEETVNSDFAKEDEEKKSEEKEDTENSNDSEDSAEDDDDKDKEKYTLLKEEYDALQAQYSKLETDYKNLEVENTELKNFKITIEDKQKDALIQQFYMLSYEDKKDVIENKNKYTLDEIKSKLAVICFEKKVNFNLNNDSDNKKQNTDIVTFNLEYKEDSTPDWVKQVELTMNSEK